MKLIEVNAAKEFANTFLGDPILKMAVNAVLDHAPAADVSKLTSAEKQAIFRLGQMDMRDSMAERSYHNGEEAMREKVIAHLTEAKRFALGMVRSTLDYVIERVREL